MTFPKIHRFLTALVFAVTACAGNGVALVAIQPSDPEAIRVNELDSAS